MQIHTIRIGKKGLNPNAIQEIERGLKDFDTIKIKFLKNILESSSRQELKESLEKSLPQKITVSKPLGNTVTISKAK